ncbi:MAG TPA: hypothetical protein PLN21_10455 [Gemmatales bacterium]|nr:hypothetical protein [Gemmatales bacterium]
MKRFMLVTIAMCSITGTLYAQRGRPGGFTPGASVAGGGAARPNMQPNMQMGQMNRPNPGMQQMQRPQASVGGMQGTNRSFISAQQQANLQQRPTTMPSVFSQQPNQGTMNRPMGGMTSGGMTPGITRPVLPGTGTGIGMGNTTLPTTRPSVQQPNTTLPGVGRPTTPNNPWTRPGIVAGDINRPGTGGITRPDTGVIATRPIDRRPGAGVDVGMDRPTIPKLPPINGGITRPNTGIIATRPNDRPGIDTRPNIRPTTNRPIVNQPINIGNQINNTINNRPNWVNINNTQITNINNTWNNTIVNQNQMHNWVNNNPNRGLYWNNWGNGVRNNWRYYNYHNNWFGGDWWSRYHPAYAGWNYRAWLPYYPYNYWWSVPTFAGVTTWFNWNLANSAAWQQPIYYDYGTGGNVVYQNNQVYIGGQPVASAPEFAQSAAALATVTPPASEEQGAQAEWMPLGTFAMSTGEKDTEPTRVLQLAVTKEGIIGGTFFNYQTDQAVSIQGQVDKQTQRVAFRIGERDNIVAETGLYNLTQEQAPLLVHFGDDKVEQFLLIRLKNDEQGQPK